MSAPRELPILFSGDMVRAVLDDAAPKTATRRTAGLGQVNADPDAWRFVDWTPAFRDGLPRAVFDGPAGTHYLRCPYGQAGGRLWVREEWQEFFDDEIPAGRTRAVRGHMGIPAQPNRLSYVAFRADGEIPPHPEHGKAVWRRSIHMPRWASRTLLEVTAVRLRRLKDITEREAMAEGAQWREVRGHDGVALGGWSMRRPHPAEPCLCEDSAVMAFARYINELHGGPRWHDRPTNLWLQNPWVWVVEFRRVQAAQEGRG